MRRWALPAAAVVVALAVGAAVVAQQSGKPAENVKVAKKVVPIVSLGKGVRVGAAMVVGPEEYVRTVGVVAQIEGRLGKTFRVRALVPAAALPENAPPDQQKLLRVPKVSVAAVIDMRI